MKMIHLSQPLENENSIPEAYSIVGTTLVTSFVGNHCLVKDPKGYTAFFGPILSPGPIWSPGAQMTDQQILKAQALSQLHFKLTQICH